MAITETDGFLLTRQWRDTPQGLELVFWLSTKNGPLRLRLSNEKAVCFIKRANRLNLSRGIERKAVQLNTLSGEPVDALYFSRQRDLSQLREHLAYDKQQLFESELKPADRFLMERFITAGLTARGEITQCEGYQEIIEPQLKPADYSPALRWVSLDIETHDFRGPLYSIAVTAEDQQRVFMVQHASHASLDQHAPEHLQTYPDEKTTLNAFFDWLRQYDPDLILGWNVIGFDLHFLNWKCEQLRIPFAIGRGTENATILSAKNSGQVAVARIPGRVVLDGIACLKSAFWLFEDYTLGNVAQQLLGEDKLISAETDKLAEIRRQYREEPIALAEYNLKDCELVARIFEHTDLINFSIARSRMTGLAMDRHGGSVAAFDHLYLPQLHRHGRVAPDVGSLRDAANSPGGYVMDSTPGLYRNVLVLDFKSLYPSIIRTFNIDPLGLFIGAEEAEESTENTIPGFLDAQFSRDTHILPSMVETLWNERDTAKAESNAPLSQAIKIIMNSFYGVLGSSGCRFFNPQLASSITRRGHEIIQHTAEFIEQQGHTVIYGDTDSVFVHLGDEVEESAARNTGQHLAQQLNTHWQQRLEQQFKIESRLEIEFETHYLRFLMPTIRGSEAGSKKRYAGVVRRGDETKMIFKGLESVRSDWTLLARNFQQELYRRIFYDLPYADYVREVTDQLFAGELDDQLVYTKRLRRPLESYVSTQPPQVKAARKMRKPSRRVQYLITLDGPEPTENLTAAPDYHHYQDKQLQPVADGILHFVDTTYERLTQRQMDVFGD